MPEIPIPANKLLLLDLDDTLIDKNYKFNADIRDEITQLNNKDWLIGLSSDSSFETLQIWSHKLGINGPIIFERGAGYELGGEQKRVAGASFEFIKSRKNIEVKLRNMGVLVWRGNPVEALINGLVLNNARGSVAMINSLRRYSLSLHPREVDSLGKLKLNKQLTHDIAGSIESLYPQFEDLVVDINLESGVIIASRGIINKRLATKLLMEKLEIDNVGMIGNSLSDFLGSDIATHYAVGNASSEFKNLADFSANSYYTQGVKEILSLLL